MSKVSLALVGSLLLLVPTAAAAQEISKIHVPQRAEAGVPVPIVIDFQVGVTPPGCGLKLMLGDGTVLQLRADATNMPLRIEHVYPGAGEFDIVARGAFYGRGMKTALACSGTRTAVVSVADTAAERRREEQERARKETAERQAKVELDRTQRDVAARRAQLEEQERALKARETEVRRLAQEKEREIAERAADLRRREQAFAIDALKAREKAEESQQARLKADEAYRARQKAEEEQVARRKAEEAQVARQKAEDAQVARQKAEAARQNSAVRPTSASTGSGSAPRPAPKGTLDAF
jgi:hypothetical protein